MKRRLLLTVFTLALLLPGAGWAQRRDPLNEAESDQLRDTADEPAPRLALLLKFAQLRLASIDQLRADPKAAAGRGQQIHDRLQDFLSIYDELGDNLDMYAGRNEDLRKPLKLILERDTEFQSRLRALKQAAAGTEAGEAKDYDFVLTNAIEAVSSGVGDQRKLLQEQEADAKAGKFKKDKARP